MKRILFCLALTILLTLVLSGCACQHQWSEAPCGQAPVCQLCGQRGSAVREHNWVDACGQARTCSLCGMTQDIALDHNWQDATCTAPKTCSLCGQTEGEALGHSWDDAICGQPKTCLTCGATDNTTTNHSWKEATCEHPKTCNICAATEGEPLQHLWKKPTCTTPQSCLLCGLWTTPALGHSWLEATCEDPVRCEFCDVTQGEPLGHIWTPATPEAPQTCQVCGKTEGLPIELDDRFLSEDCLFLFGSWTYSRVDTAEELGIPGFDHDLTEHVTYTFGIYGDLTIRVEVADLELYRQMLTALYINEAYAPFEDPAEAEQYYLDTYQMTLEAYAADLAASTPIEEINYTETGVYYVADGAICLSDYWEDPFGAYPFTLEGDTLTMTDPNTGDELIMTRII
jgi:hypothetical protein